MALAGIAALVPMTTGVDAVGALVGLSARTGTGNVTTTFTTSTKHVTTTERVDLEDAPAPACDFPGAPRALVDTAETSLEPVVEVNAVLGPAEIMIGEDQSEPFSVLAGTVNYDTLTIYETVVTQYFQATAAGESCAVLAAAARFTG